MGSKLRKKKVLKPVGYEDRLAMLKKAKQQRLEDDSFGKIFYSMQYISYTVLWSAEEDEGFDFSEQQLKDMGIQLKKHSELYNDRATLLAMEYTLKEMTGFCCFKEATHFPYSIKMKMYGKPLRKKDEYLTVLDSVTDAIAVFLVVTANTLKIEFGFNGEMLHKWWDKCLEVAELYRIGMTDKFIIDFMEQESGVEFEREE